MQDAIYYPSAAASTETMFVSGYKFDICEVHPCNDEFILPANGMSRNGARYFIEVEGRFIVGFDKAESLHRSGCYNRWDVFCMSKSSAKEKVLRFAKLFEDLKHLQSVYDMRPKQNIMLLPKIDFLKSAIMKGYGVNI